MKKLICTKLLICFTLNMLVFPIIECNNTKKLIQKNRCINRRKKRRTLRPSLRKITTASKHKQNGQKKIENEILKKLPKVFTKKAIRQAQDDRESEPLKDVLINSLVGTLKHKKLLFWTLLGALLGKVPCPPCYGKCIWENGLQECCVPIFSWTAITTWDCNWMPGCYETDPLKNRAITYALKMLLKSGKALECFGGASASSSICMEPKTTNYNPLNIILSAITTIEGVITLAVTIFLAYFFIKNMNKIKFSHRKIAKEDDDIPEIIEEESTEVTEENNSSNRESMTEIESEFSKSSEYSDESISEASESSSDINRL